MLIFRNVDPPGLVVELLVVPGRVDPGQLAGDVVVLAQEERVERDQQVLLVSAGVS